jgi:Na+/H+ antiporter NhaD/arsenite permease-like protein
MFLFSIFLPSFVYAGSGVYPNIGETLPLYSVIPFVGMLLSIALFPLLVPKFWHHHFGKVSAFWAIVIAVPLLISYKEIAVYEILHIILADYVPFIILLGSLYTVSGGILLRGTLVGTPIVNTAMLTVGTLLASWMGTTGAAMLLIRPFLRANAHRKNRTFMVVFFIFLVANIGGSLTPLGDPPLFLGFLRGVPFFWTFNLLPQMIVAGLILLSLYFILDTYFYKKEGIKAAPDDGTKEPLKLEGSYNFIFLAGIIGAVLMSGMAKWGEVSIFGIHRGVQDVVRDIILILMAVLSMTFTPKVVREDNAFTWFPIKEVAILFIGIFLTMIPCLKILQAGTKGELAFIISAVREPVHYFWITGILSAFLDNAPTYLTFLSTAMGSFYPGIPESQAVALLIKEKPIYLLAVSTGAVFFGAVTYIGNAPNFMVRSIAEEAGTPMPSFFGYMLKYSIPILLTVFLIITLIFFI